MQQEEEPIAASTSTSTTTTDEDYYDADLAAAITDALNESSVGDSGDGGVSETSSLRSIDVTQELNDLLRTADAGEEEEEEKEEEEEEHHTVGKQDETIFFEDVNRTNKKDKNTIDNNSSSFLFETIGTTNNDNDEKGVVAAESSSPSTDYTSSVSIETSNTSENDQNKMVDEEPMNRNNKSPHPKHDETEESAARVVPLKQFENALALIQDLENRIQVLETNEQCLLEENTTLKEETARQADLLVQLEDKLVKFPKLLEDTVAEEAQVAAATAETKTRISFWKKDMQRQEKEHAEEKLKQQRTGSCHAHHTTESLQQSDFLKDLVERKETGEHSTSVSSLLSFYSNKSETMTPITSSAAVPPKKTTGFFSTFRGFGGKGHKHTDGDKDNTNGDNNKNNNPTTTNDENDVDDNDTKNDATNNDKQNKSLEKKRKKKNFQTGNNVDAIDIPELNTSGEIKYNCGGGVDDNHIDDNVLDLLT